MYVNISTNEILHITKSLLKQNNNDTLVSKQIFYVIKYGTKPKYFEYVNKVYKPNKGVAMGSPISGILAEIFLQYHEQLT